MPAVICFPFFFYLFVGHAAVERDGDGHGSSLPGQVLPQPRRQALLVQRLPHARPAGLHHPHTQAATTQHRLQPHTKQVSPPAHTGCKHTTQAATTHNTGCNHTQHRLQPHNTGCNHTQHRLQPHTTQAASTYNTGCNHPQHRLQAHNTSDAKSMLLPTN